MFVEMIYYDKKTIAEYKVIIQGSKSLEISEYEIANDKGGKVDLKALSAGTKATKKYTAKVMGSMLYDYAEFENMLENRDDFFDFTKDEFDIKTINRGSIIKFDSFFRIPEEFDMVQSVEDFKSLIMSYLDSEEIDKDDKEVVQNILENAKTSKIPLVMDNDEYVFSSKINKENLISEIMDLEEFEDEEVTILARLASGVISENKPYYDPLKDYISLNRAMRKNIGDLGDEFKPFKLDRKYRKIDVLAIYR